MRRDLKHGFGKFVWPNNDQYIGNWEEDKMNGFGKFVHHEVPCSLPSNGRSTASSRTTTSTMEAPSQSVSS